MKKFTIFTILLTVVVVVVFVQLIGKENLPGNVAADQSESGEMKLTLPKSLDVKKSIATNVLGSGGVDGEMLDVSDNGVNKNGKDIPEGSASGDDDGASNPGLAGVDNGTAGGDGSGGASSSGVSGAIETDDGDNSGDGGLNNRLGADNEFLPVESPVGLPVRILNDVVVENPDFLDPDAFEDGAEPVDVTNFGAENAAIGLAIPRISNVSEAENDSKDFEDQNFAPAPTGNVYLRDEQIKSAGFTSGTLENESWDGRLFKTIDISDLKDVEVTKTAIKNQSEVLAKVYIFKIGLNTNVSEVYQMLKMRAAQGLNIKTNETNQFGIASFYMNDQTRSDTAFLTVRISGLIYAFSYPKMYHSQVKNLLQLIQWELG